MSIHPSLRGVNTRQGERSVLSRFERVAKMIKEGRLDPQTNSVVGLPKMRTKFKIIGGKKPKAEAAPADAKGAKPGAKAAPAGKAAPAKK